jgi:predicted XRE-type DNA-binding protein
LKRLTAERVSAYPNDMVVSLYRYRQRAMTKKRCEASSGNVFKDIGIPNADEHLIKAQLVFKIETIMKDRGLKQVEAADLFGIRQPDISKMCAGSFASSLSNDPCVFSSRSIRMWRSS